ncbi:hypothetical protein BB560_003652, partial [Smittium megazygosporum]
SVYIEDIFSYVNQILIDIAIRTCYGEAAKKDPAFLSSINLLLSQNVSYGERCINDLLKFRIFNKKSNIEKAKCYLRDFTVFNFLLFYLYSKQCLADFILKNQLKYNISNDIFYTSLPSYFYLFVTLLGYKLSNFLIDISLNPTEFKKLEAEQKAIIVEHQKTITAKHLNKMVQLDAAIAESVRLGNSKLSMKEALHDVFLSNGIFVPKGSIVQFNTISYDRSHQIFNKHPHDFIPERHFELGTKLGETSPTNLVWGYERTCPYRNYCANIMKLFVANLIRGYTVSQGNGPPISTGLRLKGVEFGLMLMLRRIQ